MLSLMHSLKQYPTFINLCYSVQILHHQTIARKAQPFQIIKKDMMKNTSTWDYVLDETPSFRLQLNVQHPCPSDRCAAQFNWKVEEDSIGTVHPLKHTIETYNTTNNLEFCLDLQNGCYTFTISALDSSSQGYSLWKEDSGIVKFNHGYQGFYDEYHTCPTPVPTHLPNEDYTIFYLSFGLFVPILVVCICFQYRFNERRQQGRYVCMMIYIRQV